MQPAFSTPAPVQKASPPVMHAEPAFPLKRSDADRYRDVIGKLGIRK